jgi:hypothetical protein
VTTDQLLNLAARVLLRTLPPLKAHAVLRRVGRLLPERRSRPEILAAAEKLGAGGSCLSRALALAARAPSATVVIGVQPEPGKLLAHAWLEVGGQPLRPSDPMGQEIARLP